MYQFKVKCKKCGQIELVNTGLRQLANQKIQHLCCSDCWNKKFNIILGICEECGNKFNIKEDCKCQKR
jgi:ribosomal protein L37E